MNRFEFLGRLTKDPEIRYTSGTNTKIVLFTLAVNRRYVEQGKSRETDFFNLTSFGKLGDFVEKYFNKGQQVLVEGRIQNRTWEDDKGQKRYATDFIVEQCYFADSNKNEAEKTVQTTENDFISINPDTEELPF